jgi:hypothetical protein
MPELKVTYTVDEDGAVDFGDCPGEPDVYTNCCCPKVGYYNFAGLSRDITIYYRFEEETQKILLSSGGKFNKLSLDTHTSEQKIHIKKISRNSP